MTAKKILKDIEAEMDFCLERMRYVSPESDEYRDLQNRYGVYLQMRNEILKPKGTGKVFGAIFEGFIKAAGTIFVPLGLGFLAYNGDKDIKLVNQRIWNLISKRTDK